MAGDCGYTSDSTCKFLDKEFLLCFNNLQILCQPLSVLFHFVSQRQAGSANSDFSVSDILNRQLLFLFTARLGWRCHQCQRVIDRPDLGSQLLEDSNLHIF